jgi:hypothetical protein
MSRFEELVKAFEQDKVSSCSYVDHHLIFIDCLIKQMSDYLGGDCDEGKVTFKFPDKISHSIRHNADAVDIDNEGFFCFLMSIHISNKPYNTNGIGRHILNKGILPGQVVNMTIGVKRVNNNLKDTNDTFDELEEFRVKVPGDGEEFQEFRASIGKEYSNGFGSICNYIFESIKSHYKNGVNGRISKFFPESKSKHFGFEIFQEEEG